MKLFDTHCHLADKAYDGDRDRVLERAWRAGLVGAVCVGYDLESSRAAVELAGTDERLWAAVGVHPHDAGKAGPGLGSALRELSKKPRVVALGEAGLDYYRNLSPREVQKVVFRCQVELALELGLPLIVHDRDAHDGTLDILTEYYRRPPAQGGVASPEQPAGPAGVLHCFSGDRAMAWTCLDLGFLVSFAGPLTYPKAGGTREVARALPLDKVLVETDCPYLAPQSKRGKRNEPGFVAEVALALAALRGLPADVAAHQTTRNARRLFRLV